MEVVELIWEAWHNGEVRAGDPWDIFIRLLSNDTGKVPVLYFHSYDELKEIMKIAFEMYEDFKRELILFIHDFTLKIYEVMTQKIRIDLIF